MPQIRPADFKTGMTVDLDEGLFNISDFQHVKPGKGGAFVRTTLKNVRTGAVLALRASGDGFAEEAEEVATGLYLANGIAFDPSQEHLYVAETMMDRVLR